MNGVYSFKISFLHSQFSPLVPNLNHIYAFRDFSTYFITSTLSTCLYPKRSLADTFSYRNHLWIFTAIRATCRESQRLSKNCTIFTEHGNSARLLAGPHSEPHKPIAPILSPILGKVSCCEMMTRELERKTKHSPHYLTNIAWWQTVTFYFTAQLSPAGIAQLV